MKLICYLLVAAFFSAAMCGALDLEENRDTIFQTSTFNALLEGIYDGNMTYGELREHGDFGIGTFNNLDGEMVAVDGNFYQIKVDGKAYSVDDSMKTPFASVTFFEPDDSMTIDEDLNYSQLSLYLDNLLPTENIFYAFKIDGTFKYIKGRAPPRQEEPYLRLVDALRDQQIYEFQNVSATLAGFRCPGYIGGLNVPGYHLHFITDDKMHGGHLQDCQLDNVSVEIDYINEFSMVLPHSSEFYNVDLSEHKPEEVKKVEE